ncbi:uncharacterized protein V6R79_025670 [Siganus canaliculatus]
MSPHYELFTRARLRTRDDTRRRNIEAGGRAGTRKDSNKAVSGCALQAASRALLVSLQGLVIQVCHLPTGKRQDSVRQHTSPLKTLETTKPNSDDCF